MFSVDMVIDMALADAQEITFAFQGGEPTMAGLNYFIHFVEYVEKLKKDLNSLPFEVIEKISSDVEFYKSLAK